MSLLLQSIESKIRESIEKGELDNLPGSGKPMDLSDDPFTPEHLRMTYRILKSANFAPKEVELIKEVAELKEKLEALPASAQTEREALIQTLRLKEAEVATRIESLRRASSPLK